MIIRLTFHMKSPFVLPETITCSTSGLQKNKVINRGQIPTPEKKTRSTTAVKLRSTTALKKQSTTALKNKINDSFTK